MKLIISIIFSLTLTAPAAVTLQFSNGLLVGTNGAGSPAATPTFSPDGGLAGASVTVASGSPSPVNLYITTNGATPTTNLSPVASPATVTAPGGGGVIKALAWTNSGTVLPSAVATSAPFTNAGEATYTLTASNTATTGHDARLVGVSDSTRYQWTLVTIPAGANLAKFELLMGVAAGSPTGYLTGLVHSVSGSTPTSTQLGISAGVSASGLAALGTSNWLGFTLTTPIATSTPITVALGVTRNATSFSDNMAVWTPDPFLLTGCWATTNTTEFIDSASRQLNFRTYSTP